MFKLWQDPANFLEGPPFKQTPVMVKGQQIDTYVLEPQLFRTKYEVTCKGPWNANPGKADATRIRKMGKTPLKPETMNDIQTILTRLESPGQEETCRQMLSGEPQVAVKGVVECNYLLDGEPFTNFIPLTGLLDSVWTDSYGTDMVLKVSIHELRKVFEDDARKPRYIQTLHRRGYRFIGRLDVA